MAKAKPTPTNSPHTVRTRDTAITLMRRTEGATLAELTAATGWLPHSARAIISGLRKQGHAISREKRGKISCYRVAETA